MIAMVSPYHLTTREPALMAALLYADRAVTLLPEPAGDARANAEAAAGNVPEYLEFMESWAWSIPLWEQGLLSSRLNHRDPVESMRLELDRIASDPRCEMLRPLMNARMLGQDDEYLSVVSQDILRSGTDPGVAVPVALGIDRFAARFNATVFRSEPRSIVQKTEQRWATPLAAAAVPLLLQCSASRMLEAREALAIEIVELREALASQDKACIRQSSHRLSRAFEIERESLMRTEDPDEPPVMSVNASISITSMPAEASLLASAAAAATYIGPSSSGGREPTKALRLGAEHAVNSAVIKTIGRPAPLRS